MSKMLSLLLMLSPATMWDKDEPLTGLPVNEALKNAPQSRQDQVVVPKVIEE